MHSEQGTESLEGPYRPASAFRVSGTRGLAVYRRPAPGNRCRWNQRRGCSGSAGRHSNRHGYPARNSSEYSPGPRLKSRRQVPFEEGGPASLSPGGAVSPVRPADTSLYRSLY